METDRGRNMSIEKKKRDLSFSPPLSSIITLKVEIFRFLFFIFYFYLHSPCISTCTVPQSRIEMVFFSKLYHCSHRYVTKRKKRRNDEQVY